MCMQLCGNRSSAGVCLGGDAMLYSNLQKKLLNISMQKVLTASEFSYIHELLL